MQQRCQIGARRFDCRLGLESRVKLAHTVSDYRDRVRRITVAAERDPNSAVGKALLDFGSPYQPSSDRGLADAAKPMYGADHRATFLHGLVTQQMSKQRTGELRPIDIIHWHLFAWNRDADGRMVSNAYAGARSGNYEVAVSLEVLSYKARLGAPQTFTERRPGQFFLW